MNWAAVSQALAREFTHEILTLNGGTIFSSPNGALDLQEILRHACETDEELDEVGRTPEEAMDPASMLLGKRFNVDDLLSFDWDGFGATSSAASLGAVDLGEEGQLAYFWQDSLWPSEVAYALLTPSGSAELWSALILDLLRDNGSRYGIGLFGSLPSNAVNWKPDLVSGSSVKEAYWHWLENTDGGTGKRWASLRSELIGQLEQPDSLIRSLGMLQKVSTLGPEGYLQAGAREVEPLSEADRRLILDNYFNLCYRTEARH